MEGLIPYIIEAIRKQKCEQMNYNRLHHSDSSNRMLLGSADSFRRRTVSGSEIASTTAPITANNLRHRNH